MRVISTGISAVGNKLSQAFNAVSHLYINRTDRNGFTPLARAIFDNDIGEVERLLENGADVNARSVPKNPDYPGGATPIMWAIQYGRVEIANILINHGASLKLDEREGDTPLISAIRKKRWEIFSRLLEEYADREGELDIDEPNKHGDTALSLAVTIGDEWAVNALKQYGADLAKAGSFGRTPLICAVYHDREELIDVLLPEESEEEIAKTIDLQDENGDTALMVAVREGHAEIVEKLKKRGANLDIQNNDGKTTLMIAIEEISNARSYKGKSARADIALSLIDVKNAIPDYNGDITVKDSSASTAIDMITTLHKEAEYHADNSMNCTFNDCPKYIRKVMRLSHYIKTINQRTQRTPVPCVPPSPSGMK